MPEYSGPSRNFQFLGAIAFIAIALLVMGCNRRAPSGVGSGSRPTSVASVQDLRVQLLSPLSTSGDRMLAANDLGNSSPGIAILLAEAGNENDAVRGAVAAGLSGRRSVAELRTLETLAFDRSELVAVIAIGSLRSAPVSPSLPPRARHFLKDPSPLVRRLALVTLASFGHRADLAVLSQLKNDPSPMIREELFKQLAWNYGALAKPILEEGTHDLDRTVADAAKEALSRL